MRSDGTRRTKISNAVATAATLIGTCKVFGTISGIWLFTSLAQTLAISPAPAPYSHIRRGFGDDYTKDLAFGCEDKTGTISWHRWDYKVRGAVPGPHRYNTSIFEFFGLIRRDRDGYDENRLRNLGVYYFCHAGMLARAAGCPEALNAVILMNHEPNSGRETTNERLACSP